MFIWSDSKPCISTVFVRFLIPLASYSTSSSTLLNTKKHYGIQIFVNIWTIAEDIIYVNTPNVTKDREKGSIGGGLVFSFIRYTDTVTYDTKWEGSLKVFGSKDTNLNFMHTHDMWQAITQSRDKHLVAVKDTVTLSTQTALEREKKIQLEKTKTPQYNKFKPLVSLSAVDAKAYTEQLEIVSKSHNNKTTYSPRTIELTPEEKALGIVVYKNQKAKWMFKPYNYHDTTFRLNFITGVGIENVKVPVYNTPIQQDIFKTQIQAQSNAINTAMGRLRTKVATETSKDLSTITPDVQTVVRKFDNTQADTWKSTSDTYKIDEDDHEVKPSTDTSTRDMNDDLGLLFEHLHFSPYNMAVLEIFLSEVHTAGSWKNPDHLLLPDKYKRLYLNDKNEALDISIPRKIIQKNDQTTSKGGQRAREERWRIWWIQILQIVEDKWGLNTMKYILEKKDKDNFLQAPWNYLIDMGDTDPDKMFSLQGSHQQQGITVGQGAYLRLDDVQDGSNPTVSVNITADHYVKLRSINLLCGRWDDMFLEVHRAIKAEKGFFVNSTRNQHGLGDLAKQLHEYLNRVIADVDTQGDIPLSILQFITTPVWDEFYFYVLTKHWKEATVDNKEKTIRTLTEGHIVNYYLEWIKLPLSSTGKKTTDPKVSREGKCLSTYLKETKNELIQYHYENKIPNELKSEPDTNEIYKNWDIVIEHAEDIYTKQINRIAQIFAAQYNSSHITFKNFLFQSFKVWYKLNAANHFVSTKQSNKTINESLTNHAKLLSLGGGIDKINQSIEGAGGIEPDARDRHKHYVQMIENTAKNGLVNTITSDEHKPNYYVEDLEDAHTFISQGAFHNQIWRIQPAYQVGKEYKWEDPRNNSEITEALNRHGNPDINSLYVALVTWKNSVTKDQWQRVELHMAGLFDAASKAGYANAFNTTLRHQLVKRIETAEEKLVEQIEATEKEVRDDWQTRGLLTAGESSSNALVATNNTPQNNEVSLLNVTKNEIEVLPTHKENVTGSHNALIERLSQEQKSNSNITALIHTMNFCEEAEKEKQLEKFEHVIRTVDTTDIIEDPVTVDTRIPIQSLKGNSLISKKEGKAVADTLRADPRANSLSRVLDKAVRDMNNLVNAHQIQNTNQINNVANEIIPAPASLITTQFVTGLTSLELIYDFIHFEEELNERNPLLQLLGLGFGITVMCSKAGHATIYGNIGIHISFDNLT